MLISPCVSQMLKRTRLAETSTDDEGESNSRRPTPTNSRSAKNLKKKDPVWDEFLPTSDPEMQECKTCSKRLKTSKGSKWGLSKHVASHGKKGRKVIRDDLKAWLVATILTVLNVPCRVFGFFVIKILFWLARLGPINENMARSFGDAEAKKAKELVKTDIRTLLQERAVFTITADEWTCQRKRFLGVTIHCSKVLPSLGEKSVEILTRFTEQATAKTLMATLRRAIDTFGLEVKNLSGLTTDGAAVMKKLGRMMEKEVAPRPFYHQTCFAHGLHLAVLDSLKESSEGLGENGAETERFIVGLEAPGDNFSENELERDLEEEQQAGSPEFNGQEGRILEEIRKVCRKFQGSAARSDAVERVTQTPKLNLYFFFESLFWKATDASSR